MAWIETHSLSFTARHEEDSASAAAALLDDLEDFRAGLAERLPEAPGEVSVVIHPRSTRLALAQPWLPLLRLASAPAGRRYLTGGFTSREIHVLDARALDARASAVPGSRDALRLSPRHEYAHMAVGASNPALPPPFTPGTLRSYRRMAWLCEGAATHLSGQSRHLAPAIVRRMKEDPPPTFPPSFRDALLLGGTVYDLAAEADARAPIRLATATDPGAAREVLERAFLRSMDEIEGEWRARLGELTAG